MNVIKLLEEKAKRFSSRPAAIFKDEPINFLQLKDSSFRLASSLMSLGLKKGDKVAIYLPNCLEYIYSYYAIWSCGATAVPLDFMLAEEEIISCICHSEAKLLITKPKQNISLAEIKDKCPQLRHVVICQGESGPNLSFEELLRNGASRAEAVNIADKDHACIFYTSGTTGKPKGVLCNYLQLEASPKAMSYFVDLSDKDIALCGALPFSHLGGLVFVQAILFLGTTVVLMDRFIPLEFLKLIQQHKVSCFWIVPSMYYAILQLKEFENFNFSSLKWVVCFGAPSSADQLRRFHQYCLNADLINGWGMTETQGPTVVLPRGSNKVESVGLPEPWMEVKIFDKNDNELPNGQVGEIVVRGWAVTEGYYKDPEATASALRNGWFHTGDLGWFDKEGYLYIAGRIKEMIKVAGEIVFEPEVEQALHRHPDVAEAAVIGVPDKLRGEVPRAYVVLKEGSHADAESLRCYLRPHLAHFKIPHCFEFTTHLPKTRTGKVDKEKLRKDS